MNGLSLPQYKSLLAELKARIHGAQYVALRAVNKELITLYWDIGKLIDERQTTEGWGNSVVEFSQRLACRIWRKKRLFRAQSLVYAHVLS
jgi:hypothetical protein